ncbi:MAG: M48 family metallopeptidase [Woeseia sp.]
MRTATFPTLLIVTVSLAACAAPSTRQSGLDPELVRVEEERQKQLALKKDYEYSQRLQRVSWPILRDASQLCEGNLAPRFGFQFDSVHSYSKEYQTAAAAVLKLSNSVSVVSVAPGSPADIAGIKFGDAVLTINDNAITGGKEGVKRAQRIIAKALEKSPELKLTLSRKGEVIPVDITGQSMCRFSALLMSTDVVNAYADGNAIYVTSGMMRFAADDNQLAVVVAHELAHNSQEHIKAKTSNYLLGSIFDVAAAVYGVNTQGAFGGAASRAYSQAFEAEADYVGMYALALADVDYSMAADFWREMGIQNPGSIAKSYASSHPSTAERYISLENTAAEIDLKRSQGAALNPEKK